MPPEPAQQPGPLDDHLEPRRARDSGPRSRRPAGVRIVGPGAPRGSPGLDQAAGRGAGLAGLRAPHQGSRARPGRAGSADRPGPARTGRRPAPTAASTSRRGGDRRGPSTGPASGRPRGCGGRPRRSARPSRPGASRGSARGSPSPRCRGRDAPRAARSRPSSAAHRSSGGGRPAERTAAGRGGRPKVGGGRRLSRKRATRSGQSKPRPLYVTSQPWPAGRSAIASSIPASPAWSGSRSWTWWNRSPVHQPSPTRKATVPAPVARPVVSVSRQTSGTSGPGWSGQAGDPIPVDGQADRLGLDPDMAAAGTLDPARHRGPRPAVRRARTRPTVPGRPTGGRRRPPGSSRRGCLPLEPEPVEPALEDPEVAHRPGRLGSAGRDRRAGTELPERRTGAGRGPGRRPPVRGADPCRPGSLRRSHSR